jgi:hypothetical protein
LRGRLPFNRRRAEYCAEDSSDRGKHAKDDRGNGIQHHFDRVGGRARRDHNNAATRCDKQRRDNAECHEPQQEEDHPAYDHRSRNASNQAARRRRPCDWLVRCVHNRLSRDLLLDFRINCLCGSNICLARRRVSLEALGNAAPAQAD